MAEKYYIENEKIIQWYHSYKIIMIQDSLTGDFQMKTLLGYMVYY